MQGSLHQAVALTVSGNAVLQGLEVGPLWADGTGFSYCREIRFMDGSSIVAANPALWLEGLAGRGAGLKLRIVPRNDPAISDMMAVGFANGGPRLLIEADVPGRGCSWWEADWEVTGGAAERRIWTVTYFRLPDRPLAPWPAERPLGKIAHDLATALEDLTEFVERAGPGEAIPGWADHFRSARATLDGQPQWQESDPPPPGFLSTEALRLLHACRAGWVFGGMGSWNDGSYWGSVEAEGGRLSETLFALLQEGVAAVANSSCRAD